MCEEVKDGAESGCVKRREDATYLSQTSKQQQKAARHLICGTGSSSQLPGQLQFLGHLLTQL
jgi:lysine/ornithine N-monooxygenase